MDKAYSRIFWQNEPNESTPLDANNLNLMDSAINELDNRVVSIDTTKASKEEIFHLVNNITYDKKTGIISINYVDGSDFIIDLNIEKIPISFSLSEDGILTMITEDGTVFSCDIAKLIRIYSFVDSEQISFSVTKVEGENYTVAASIKEGSITQNLLQPDYLADIKVEAESAIAASNNANEKSAFVDQAYNSVEESKQHIDSVKSEIDEIKVNIEHSEVNAKQSESNAKKSENSALQALSSISEMKTYVENAKNTVEETAEEVSENAEIASNSAEIAKNAKDKAITAETNAKTYSEQAKNYSDSAYESVGNSLTYSEQSKAASNSALLHETNAKNSATKANESANRASASEINAKSSETLSFLYMQSAEEYKNAALESQNKALASERNALQSQNKSLNSEKNANASKETAKIYADQAKDYTESIPGIIEEALETNIPVMSIDFTTGHLMWSGGRFVFAINEETGRLMWEVS